MTSELRTSIALLAGAPTIWMAYFWLVYLVAEVDCRFGAAATTTVVVTLAASVVAAAATAWLTWWSWRLLQTGEFNRPLSLAGVLIGAISIVAVVFVGVERAGGHAVLSVLAHVGSPVAPHDLWGSWRIDPVLVMGIVAVVILYARGTRAWDGRTLQFAAAMVALSIATMSPLEAAAGSLASAHMVQHLVLMLAVAPLLATSAPVERVMVGLGVTWRRAIGRLRRRTGMTPANTDFVRQPILVGVSAVAVTWWWHASVPYEVALSNRLVHHVEHATFIAAFAWFWWVVFVGRARHAPSASGVLMIFGVMMSNVLLGGLMTFAGSAWYPGYAASTSAWGLGHLADQQLAGVLMWVPPSLLYVPAALWLVVESLGLNRAEHASRPVEDLAASDTMALPPE